MLKDKSALSYNSSMDQSAENKDIYILTIKRLGKPRYLSFNSASDAMDYAIACIDGGTGIPKEIRGKNNDLVVTEEDINSYWEAKLRKLADKA